MNAKTANTLRKLAKAMATTTSTGYTPHHFHRTDGSSVVGTARCIPGSFKDCYRALKKSSDPIGIIKAEIARQSA